VVDNKVVAQAVELAGGDPGMDMRGDEVERLGCEDPGPWILIRLSRASEGARPINTSGGMASVFRIVVRNSKRLFAATSR